MPRMSRYALGFRGLLLAAALLVVPSQGFGQEVDSEDEQATENLPLEPGRTFSYEATQGTWISLDVSPDGSTIVFDLLGDLYTVPIGGGSATRLTSGMAYDVQPRYSPDGASLAFVSDRSGREQVWTLDLASGDTTQLTSGRGSDVLSPEWTPDGDYLVVPKSGRESSGLWLVHADGGSGVRMHQADGTYMTGPAFASDGRYLWFAQRQG
ncbi:MAG: hypothetical protein P8L45_09035, partial [Longimicrobiales bacterium]|nr:hypothetical protein [Longimicrobiales bacterium]